MTNKPAFPPAWKQLFVCAALAIVIVGSALAQSASAPAPAAKTASSDDGGYSTFDITPFVGWQWFQAYHWLSSYPSVDPAHHFEDGVGFGARFTEDFSNHFGAEEGFVLAYNRLDLQPSNENGFVSLPEHNLQFDADLVFNFTRRTAKVRPFVMGGGGYMEYYPPGNPNNARVPAGLIYIAPTNLSDTGEGLFTIGAGIKVNFNRRFGSRFDIRAIGSPSPSFGLPDFPGATGTPYIPWNRTNERALIVTAGLIIHLKYVETIAPAPTQVSQALRVDLPAAPSGALSVAGAHDVCPGDDLRLSVNANGYPSPTFQWRVNGTAASGANGPAFSAPTSAGTGARSVTAVVSSAPSVGTSAPFATEAGHTYHLTAEVPALGGRTAAYQWMMNGQPVAGATSSSYEVPDSGSGSVTVRVTAQNPPVTSAPANFTISPLTPPNLTFAVNPNTVPYTSGPITLRAVATASSCGGAVTVRYSGEGVTGTSFNPGAVSGFDMGNRLRQQTKTVTITATATDAKNQTVTRTAPVTVTLGAEARRLDDVVFPNMSSRVNNCGKRLLLEELTPMLRNDPGAKVILIGHRDEREKGSKAALALDTTRVLNSAAVLSAGKGICPQLDLSRIMMKAVGTDQSSTPRPALCGASTDVKEKAGQAIKDSDKNAQYRRVEVWIVPSGAADPLGVTGLTPVPSAEVQKLGCPK